MEVVFIFVVAILAFIGFLFMVGALTKDIILCTLGVHKLDKPKPGCVGILQCKRKHEYDVKCKYTVVYNWTNN